MKRDKQDGKDPYGIGYLLRTFGKKYRISIREQVTVANSGSKSDADAADGTDIAGSQTETVKTDVADVGSGEKGRKKTARNSGTETTAAESNGPAAGLGDNSDTSAETDRDGTEIWYMYVSNRRIVLTILAALIIMFAIVAVIVIYTPILDRLPGNPGARSREMLTEEMVRIDSLESELNYLMEYSRNVAGIMEGRIPETPAETADETQALRHAAVRSLQDSLLRRQIEGTGRYGLNTRTPVAGGSASQMTFFTSPVDAYITSDFNPAAGLYGVIYTITEPMQVVAVRDGTVIMSMWTPSDDYIIEVQHKDNTISIYKRNSQSLKSVGDYVEEGEVIGYVGGAGSVGADREFIFELWIDGRPVDPRSFISYY